ncbi:GDSL esterase/lipase [Rhynchospora pubera]|uniref:GDSL esterase/lipase n=1 Tax=Rhynchospora pubera TaxID=906938 RepID=A0AAV8CNE3_9POAL|nr:GDSL esterase/lipase [Rhynchospora pubera]
MRPLIVLFGDSHTEESFREGGWGAALAHHFSRSADIVLRGYNGYNTRWALKVLDRVMDGVGRSPAAITVFFGANDAALADKYNRLQHVPLDEYKENLQAICCSIKERWPSTIVILITPPPIYDEGLRKHPFGDDNSGELERTNVSTGDFAKACIDVANNSGVPVIDIWSEIQNYPGWEKSLLGWDGMHLSDQGNRILFEEVVKDLKKAGMSLETFPTDLPLFANLDEKDPLKSFTDM